MLNRRELLAVALPAAGILAPAAMTAAMPTEPATPAAPNSELWMWDPVREWVSRGKWPAYNELLPGRHYCVMWQEPEAPPAD